MQRGLKIGRLFGINIHLDWSWLLIFVLVTWNLASGFGSLHPDWDPPLAWGIAVAASLVLFASVLAHEVAHSLAARAQGMSVHRITLFLFGGVSNLQRHPPSPRAEFIIAIFGPITSVTLGVLFTLASGFGLADVMGVQMDPAEL
ncbi:MAG: site-2 protease family protein [Anaerolineales bacterium]